MRAAVLSDDSGEVLIESLTPRPPGARDVRVRLEASGICHSDLSVLSGARPYPRPVVLGHEGTGTVIEVGAEVTRARVGDTVISSFIPSCGDCFWCSSQETHLCERAAQVNFAARLDSQDRTAVVGFLGLGTWADQMVVDQASVVPVHTDLPADQIALIGCGLTTGVCAVLNTAGVVAGSTMAVIGCGGVGQAVIQGGVLAGATTIIAVDPVRMKTETAMSLGATDVVHPWAVDPVAAVLEITSGRGVDYAFEVVGSGTTIAQAFSMTRRGGSAIVVGMPASDDNVTLSASELFSQGKRLVAAKYGGAQVRRDFPRLLRLAEAGRLDLGALVTKRVDMNHINLALEDIRDGSVIRSVITW